MDESGHPSTDRAVRVDRMMLTEYPALQDSWKTLMALRFGALAFSITVLSIVLAIYRTILPDVYDRLSLGKPGLTIIALFGLMSTAVLGLIEEQSRNMCGACLERGREVEHAHEVDSGHFTRLWMAPPLLAGTEHKLLIRIVYWLIAVGWMLLMVKALRL